MESNVAVVTVPKTGKKKPEPEPAEVVEEKETPEEEPRSTESGDDASAEKK